MHYKTNQTLLAFCIFLLFSCTNDKQNKDNILLDTFTIDIKPKDSIHQNKVNELLSTAILIDQNNQINRNLFVTILKNSGTTTDTLKFTQLLDKALAFSKERRDLSNQAQLFEILSRHYYNLEQLDSTYSNLVKAEQIYNTLSDSLKSGHLALAKSKILFENGILSESKNENIKAIRYLTNSDDYILLYESTLMMGIILTELHEFEEAKQYYTITKQAIMEIASMQKFPQERIDFFLSNLNNNLSNLYFLTKDYENAKNYASKGLNKNPYIEQYPQLHASLLINLLKAKLELNELDNTLQQIQKLTDLEDTIRSTGLKTIRIASVLMLKAMYYKKTDQIQKSISAAESEYDISKKQRRLQNAKIALAFLMQNDKENQSKYIDQYIVLNDSINTIERRNKNNFARIEFEVEKVNQLNKKLAIDNQTIILFTCLLFFGFSITIFAIIQYAKNKRLLLRNKNQLANEKIYELMLEQKELAENAKSSERKRIAKELHDGIINRIFTARFHLMQLECSKPESKEVLIEELHKAEQEIRTISHILTNKLMYDSDRFDELLQNLISNQKNPFGTNFRFNIDKDIKWHLYTNEQKLNIYRIIQESLQNINKYSDASQAVISITEIKDKVVLINIKDNGNGFNLDDLSIQSRGLGLKNIQERARELKSTLQITTQPGQGVSISFTVKQKYDSTN